LIRAVVFDFDGVIANSEPLHFRAFRDVLADLDIALTEEAYYSTYLGYHDADAFRAIAADRGVALPEEQVAALVEIKAARMALLQPGNLLFPGARAAVERLAAAYPLAIASGALRAEILHVLDHERLGSFFRVVVAAEDVAAGKPAPDPYLAAVGRLSAANDLSLPAGACVAVEDSRWGLRSAREAGLRTIGVSHTYPPEELSEADRVITHLDQLTRQLLIDL
jgi:HAD superfamily hydrolase (TIGR01509 family)